MIRAVVNFDKACYVQADAEPVEWIMDFATLPRVGEYLAVRETSGGQNVARGRVTGIEHTTWALRGGRTGEAQQVEIRVQP